MSQDADRAAEEFPRTWEYYARLNPAGSARNVGGTRVCVTGVPVPTLNGVYLAAEAVEPAVVWDRRSATSISRSRRPVSALLL